MLSKYHTNRYNSMRASKRLTASTNIIKPNEIFQKNRNTTYTNINMMKSDESFTKIRNVTSLNNFQSQNAEAIYCDDSSITNEASAFSFMPNEKTKIDKAIQVDLDNELNNSFCSCDINLRWLISVCDCIIQITKFYCNDSAQALQTYFLKANINSTQYNLFYSISAYLFILPFFSGFLSQKFGPRFSLLLFCLMFVFGQFIFTMGASYNNYLTMLLGRFFFGIGSSCMEVCEDVIVTMWFFNKELTVAMGLSFAACRIGSALTSVISPRIIVLNDELNEPLIIGCYLSCLALISCIMMIFIDANYDNKKADIDDSFWLDFKVDSSKFKWQDFKKLSKVFWIFALTTMFTYTCYFGFINNANDLLCTLYDFTPQNAGVILTIFYLICAISTPLLGILIDNFGKRIFILQISLIFLIFPFVIFMILPINANKAIIIFFMIMIAVFFSSYAAVLWSSIPLIVERERQSIAFGVIYSTLNVSLVFSGLFVGIIHDSTKEYREGYQLGLVFLIICLSLANFSVIYIKEQELRKIQALNSINNMIIRDIINEDAGLGDQILCMIEETESENYEMKEISRKI